jgi:hypothetical protein
VKLPDLAAVFTAIASRPRGPRGGKVFPSDLGGVIGKKAGGCAVSLWGKIHDLPVKDSADLAGWLKFKGGDAFHKIIQDYIASTELADAGWFVAGIEKWVTHRGLNGRVDVILQHIETGQRCVVDIKSKDANFFKWAKTKPADVLQVQFYMEAENAEWGMILYVDREGKFEPIQRQVDRADDRVEIGRARLQELQDAGSLDDLPEWVEYCEGRDWQIRYCNLETCLCAARVTGGTDEDTPAF